MRAAIRLARIAYFNKIAEDADRAVGKGNNAILLEHVAALNAGMKSNAVCHEGKKEVFKRHFAKLLGNVPVKLEELVRKD